MRHTTDTEGQAAPTAARAGPAGMAERAEGMAERAEGMVAVMAMETRAQMLRVMATEMRR